MQDCGNCDLCCKFPYIPETDSKSGDYCKYCESGIGCKVYSVRPDLCRIFECCWKQMRLRTEELRPDKCGVMFEKWSDKVIIGSTEKEISDLIKNQIRYFNREGISIIISDYDKKTRTFYLAKGHTKDSVRKEINDSIKLL